MLGLRREGKGWGKGRRKLCSAQQPRSGSGRQLEMLAHGPCVGGVQDAATACERGSRGPDLVMISSSQELESGDPSSALPTPPKVPGVGTAKCALTGLGRQPPTLQGPLCSSANANSGTQASLNSTVLK